MSFLELSPPFQLCNNTDFSRLIREDCKTEFKIKTKDFSVDKKFESPTFPCNPNAYFTWKVIFRSKKFDDNFSIYLNLERKKVKNISVIVTCRFYVKTEFDHIIVDKYVQQEGSCWAWGFNEFCKMKDLRPKLGGNWSYLTICAQVSAHYEVNSFWMSYLDVKDNLHNNYANMSTDGTLSDIVLYVEQDGTEFKVHRNILSSRSKVFATMLSIKMKENLTGRIVIKNFSSLVMKKVIDYIYIGEVEFENVAMAFSLLEAAEYYELMDLKLQCGHYLSLVISKRNALTLLSKANDFGLSDLKVNVIKFLSDNKGNILDASYENLPKNVLIDIIKRYEKDAAFK